MARQVFGTNNIGGVVERRDDVPAPRPWEWRAWRREERMEGEADDRTNALSALWHFLDPLEVTVDDDLARV